MTKKPTKNKNEIEKKIVEEKEEERKPQRKKFQLTIQKKKN